MSEVSQEKHRDVSPLSNRGTLEIGDFVMCSLFWFSVFFFVLHVFGPKLDARNICMFEYLDFSLVIQIFRKK